MKIIALLILSVLTAVTNAGPPADLPLQSRFGALDKADADHNANVAAICVDMLRDIRQDTFRAASLQDEIDRAAILKKPVSRDVLDNMNNLNGRIAFHNADYAANCVPR